MCNQTSLVSIPIMQLEIARDRTVETSENSRDVILMNESEVSPQNRLELVFMSVWFLTWPRSLSKLSMFICFNKHFLNVSQQFFLGFMCLSQPLQFVCFDFVINIITFIARLHTCFYLRLAVICFYIYYLFWIWFMKEYAVPNVLLI